MNIGSIEQQAKAGVAVAGVQGAVTVSKQEERRDLKQLTK